MSQKTLLVNSSIYSFLMLLQKGINFILVPVLTLYLSTRDYGTISVITAISAFLNVFYILALNGALNRFYYEYKDNNELVKRLFGTIFTFMFFNSVVITIIIFFSRKWILEPFLGDIEFYPYMLLGLVSIIFNPFFFIYQSALQTRQKSVLYGKNNLAFFLVNLTLLLIAVIVFDQGAKGVLGALALTNFTFFLYTFFSFKNDLFFGISVDILKKCFRYSFPLIPHSLSGVATMLIDRILINKLINVSLVGIYSIGNNFGSIVFLIASGVNQAFVPWFNQRMKENDSRQVPQKVKLLILFYCILALGISFFGKDIIVLVIPEDYHNGWKVIPFIAFAFVYHGVYYFFAGVLFYDIKGRGNKIIPIITISTAILNIVFNIILIPKFGIIGASIATFISKFILGSSLSFFYNKFEDIEYPVRYMIFLPLFFFSISLLNYFSFLNQVNFFFFKVFTFLVIILLVFYLNKKYIIKMLGSKKIF